jgi:hypothetical protein
LQDNDLEGKRKAATEDRLKKVAELDEVVNGAKKIEPHRVEIVPEGK